MSLRLRLVLAAALVALVALVVADVATYSALRSSLYDRVDQTLSSTAAAGPFGPGPGPASGPGGFNPVPPSDVQRSAPGIFVERITRAGRGRVHLRRLRTGRREGDAQAAGRVTGPSGTGAPGTSS